MIKIIGTINPSTVYYPIQITRSIYPTEKEIKGFVDWTLEVYKKTYEKDYKLHWEWKL